MSNLSVGELKALSSFFNTIAAAWFTGGVIAPFFSETSLLEKAIFFIAGALLSYCFLKFSLFFVKEVKS